MAGDSFFEDASRKRKRSISNRGGRGGGNATRPQSNGKSGSSRGTSSNRGGRQLNGPGGSSGSSSRKGKGREQEPRITSRRRVDNASDTGSELESDESDEDGLGGINADGHLEEDFESEDEAAVKETPAQKRLRLAQQYLDSLKSAQQEQGGFDAADLERDLIADRLQKDVLEVSGKLHLRIADKLSYVPSVRQATSNRVHRLPLTCAVTTGDSRHLFTSSKDGSLAKWDISSLLSSVSSISSANAHVAPEASTSTSVTPVKISKIDFIPKRCPPKKRNNRFVENRSKGKAAIAKNQPSQDDDTYGHTDEIYSLAISSDGTRLASGGKDRRIGVWDISSKQPGQGCKWLKGLRGHKDAIASLKFRLGTNQLYTSAWDRTVKIYDITSLAYIETLFGHQDKIYDIAVLRNELAVTAGGRDKTVRYWKIKDETQLVFRAGGTSKIRSVLEGGLEDEDVDDDAVKAKGEEKKFVEGSVDCTAMVDDTHFISGGDSGTISLWNTGKKKPIFSVPVAHGINEFASETEGIIGNPRWIVSLASLPYSDLFVSGSWDGQIRFWKISEDIKSFEAVGSLDAPGYVNSLQLSSLAPVGGGKKGKVGGNKQSLGGKSRVLLTAALGQEHKFGRWIRFSEAKNQALVVVLDEKV